MLDIASAERLLLIPLFLLVHVGRKQEAQFFHLTWLPNHEFRDWNVSYTIKLTNLMHCYLVRRIHYDKKYPRDLFHDYFETYH